MKSGTFSKRSGAATKGVESCECWFQAAFFNLNTALSFRGQYVCMEENNLKISLALYIRLEFSNRTHFPNLIQIKVIHYVELPSLLSQLSSYTES